MTKSSLIVALVLLSVNAGAQLECSGQGEREICVSLPSDAPSSVAAPRAASAQAPSMLTRNETAGLVASVGSELTENDLSAANVAELRQVYASRSALNDAIRAQNRLRAVELHLQSSPVNTVGENPYVVISRTKDGQRR